MIFINIPQRNIKKFNIDQQKCDTASCIEVYDILIGIRSINIYLKKNRKNLLLYENSKKKQDTNSVYM